MDGEPDISMIAFGPVPSRRLGQSLGINNIPPKHCSYECIYCQVGPTPHKTTERREFYDPRTVAEAVRRKVEDVRASGGRVDYLTFVPDGEPTLDIHLAEAIDLLRPLDIPVAVITNSSLLFRDDVRRDLAGADLVSLKMDSVDREVWKAVNRPAEDLDMEDVLEGALAFAEGFEGDLITETMLVRDVNCRVPVLTATAEFISRLDPDVCYLAVPTRPPAEARAQPPDEKTVSRAYQVFEGYVAKVELLLGFSDQSFLPTGDTLLDILNITAVHPMRETEALELLRKAGQGMDQLDALVENGELVRVSHGGQPFYVRKLPLDRPRM